MSDPQELDFHSIESAFVSLGFIAATEQWQKAFQDYELLRVFFFAGAQAMSSMLANADSAKRAALYDELQNFRLQTAERKALWNARQQQQ